MAVLYRKKPAVVSAVRWVGINRKEIEDFCGSFVEFKDWGDGIISLVIITSKGECKVSRGDYIIYDPITREFCSRNVEDFKREYELAE